MQGLLNLLKRPTALAPALSLLLCLVGAMPQPALASQVGWRQITVPGGAREAAPTLVALYYPTSAAATPLAMGPFTVTAAMRAEPEATVKGLILLSHGTGGSELGHSTLAQALAQSGYLVAALRHPGDNWQDTALRDGPGRPPRTPSSAAWAGAKPPLRPKCHRWPMGVCAPWRHWRLWAWC